MLGRRIYLNLAAFVVLFVVLMAWALVSVVKPDFVIDSYEVTARFDDVNGIRPDVEVTHRGVRVGRVDSVQLSEGQAVVDLSIDADRDLPDGVHAAVRRRSAVGEPYIALTSPPGWERGDPVVPTDGSYTIPIESTTAPLAYGDLFESAQRLLSSVDKGELDTVVGELSVALGGRGDDIRRLIGRASEAASGFAGRAAVLDQLAGELTSLTALAADEAETIAASTDDLEVLVDSIAGSADDIGTLLDRTPGIAQRVDQLLAAAYAEIECGVGAAGEISKVVGDPRTIAQLVRLLRASQTAAEVIPKAIFDGPDGQYLSGTFGFAPGNLTATYDEYPQLPEPYPVIDCPGDDLPTATVGAESAVGDGQAGEGTEPSLDAQGQPDADDGEAAPASTDRRPDDDTPWWTRAMLVVAAVLAVGALAARIVRLRRN